MRFFALVTFVLLFTRSEAQDSAGYVKRRSVIATKYKGTAPGKFGHLVKGVTSRISTDKKILAFTFDACGGPKGDGYDQELIEYLNSEKIPATLFLNGRWIDDHPVEVRKLAENSLFEIENHGLLHRPCSITGRSMYGIEGTCNVNEAVDEIELNALKIQQITNRKPVFYRSATAMCDEACGKIARELGETIISYDVLSGDAVARTSCTEIMENILKEARPGGIVIMHMNHPEWNGYEALAEVIPELRRMGYSFVKLQEHPLKGRN
jgi:peptidoglycan/xylan/chitin deacetylase (PgdA/CDA1 family)